MSQHVSCDAQEGYPTHQYVKSHSLVRRDVEEARDGIGRCWGGCVGRHWDEEEGEVQEGGEGEGVADIHPVFIGESTFVFRKTSQQNVYDIEGKEGELNWR